MNRGGSLKIFKILPIFNVIVTLICRPGGCITILSLKNFCCNPVICLSPSVPFGETDCCDVFP